MLRKDKLEEWKRKKSRANASTSANPTKGAHAGTKSLLRSKVQKSAKSTIFQASTSRNIVNNERSVVNAGKKKIGANTPIGKFQARLRGSASNKENAKKMNYNKNLFGSDDDDDCGHKSTNTVLKNDTNYSDMNKIIQMKMDEAENLAMKHGTHVARAMLEELPKADECSHLELLSKSIYWLTWIKIEQNAHEWERVEKLFLRSEPLVRSAVDKRVIAVAYESFREKADAILEEKMNSIATAATTTL